MRKQGIGGCNLAMSGCLGVQGRAPTDQKIHGGTWTSRFGTVTTARVGMLGETVVLPSFSDLEPKHTLNLRKRSMIVAHGCLLLLLPSSLTSSLTRNRTQAENLPRNRADNLARNRVSHLGKNQTRILSGKHAGNHTFDLASEHEIDYQVC